MSKKKLEIFSVKSSDLSMQQLVGSITYQERKEKKNLKRGLLSSTIAEGTSQP